MPSSNSLLSPSSWQWKTCSHGPRNVTKFYKRLPSVNFLNFQWASTIHNLWPYMVILLSLLPHKFLHPPCCYYRLWEEIQEWGWDLQLHHVHTNIPLRQSLNAPLLEIYKFNSIHMQMYILKYIRPNNVSLTFLLSAENCFLECCTM